MRIYIAGPYTSDPEGCTRRAIDEANQLVDAGHDPYVPHLCHFWHQLTPRDYDDWIRIDLAWLPSAELVLRLPGHSPDADLEVARALDLDLPVFWGTAVGLLVWLQAAQEGV